MSETSTKKSKQIRFKSAKKREYTRSAPGRPGEFRGSLGYTRIACGGGYRVMKRQTGSGEWE